jgi:glycosyltransferase involved in cell wall biosynthesis
MRLGFDATSLTAAGKGVARFQREFLDAADAHDLIDELDVFIPHAPDEKALPERAGWRYHRVPTRPMIFWDLFRRPALARRLGLDVVLTLSDRAGLWGPPEVVYIYEHPKYRARRVREVGTTARQRLVDLTTLALFRISMRRAARVVAASRSTARDIGTDRVVYSGVSPGFTPGNEERSYFLHISSDDPRDNSRTVVDAYAALGADRPPLVIAGPVRAARPALEQHARELGAATEIEWRGFLSGDRLVAAYRGAIAYIDPSLYEGFGLQAAEALACGTPVIASNRTSLPEVVGDAGILLDPHDARGFSEAMRRVAGDEQLAAELGAKAVVQAAQFTWERTVRGLLEACVEIVRSREPGLA